MNLKQLHDYLGNLLKRQINPDTAITILSGTDLFEITQLVHITNGEPVFGNDEKGKQYYLDMAGQSVRSPMISVARDALTVKPTHTYCLNCLESLKVAENHDEAVEAQAQVSDGATPS